MPTFQRRGPQLRCQQQHLLWGRPMDTRLVSDGKVYPRELGWKILVVVIPVLVVVAANAWVLG